MLDRAALSRAKDKLKQFEIDRLRDAGLLQIDGRYVPCIYYPPINRLPPADEQQIYSGYAPDIGGALAVYVHVPFCVSRCAFCQCVISTTRSKLEKERYLQALKSEIDLYRKKLSYDRIPARSILFGGGTPTCLDPDQLRGFLEYFDSRFDLSRCRQFSFDVDVSTLLAHDGEERLSIMRDFGVDRLTIGAQSFDDDILKMMYRSHDAGDVETAVAQARKAGFKDICLDLIYGYPGQTMSIWARTIESAVSLGVDEMQLYRLKVISYGRGESIIAERYSSRTPDRRRAQSRASLMKLYADMRLSDLGYKEHLTKVYSRSKDDVSQYTKDMFCVLRPTAGFGLAASSSYEDRFVQSTDSFERYFSHIQEGRLPVSCGKIRSRDDQLRWALALPLKNHEVDKKRYGALTGADLGAVFRNKIRRLTQFDLVSENDERMALTERGRFFADQVCQQFYHPDDNPFPSDEYIHGPLFPYDDVEP
jgi:oxygen-independent coproporphyrinogen-3 oxidase